MDLSENAKEFIRELITQSEVSMGAKIDELSRQLNESRAEVRSLKRQLSETRLEVDDLQQYGRRMNVRLEGLPTDKGETDDALFGKIHDCLGKVGVNIVRNDIVRFHRSSAPKMNDDGVLVAQTILKFSNWDIRRRVHGTNKTAREKKVTTRIHHDLTKRRYELLGKARQRLKVVVAGQNRAEGDEAFVFADVNSNLKLRNGRDVRAFNDENELDRLITELS